MNQAGSTREMGRDFSPTFRLDASALAISFPHSPNSLKYGVIELKGKQLAYPISRTALILVLGSTTFVSE